MKPRVVHFDAPFWAAILAGVILVGAGGLIGLAAAAQDAAMRDIVAVRVRAS